MKTVATEITVAQASRRKRATDETKVRQRSYGAGGKYRMYGIDREESVDESAKCRGEDPKGLATEEDTETAWGAGEIGQSPTAMARESEGSSSEAALGGTATGRGDTWDVTSEDADEAGAGGHHRAKQRGRERVSDRREKPAGKSSRVLSR